MGFADIAPSFQMAAQVWELRSESPGLRAQVWDKKGIAYPRIHDIIESKCDSIIKVL